MDLVGTTICHMHSSPTTTVIKTSLKMAPFDALYGRRCRTPLSWDEVGDRQLFGPDLIKESEEKVKLIRHRLKVADT